MIESGYFYQEQGPQLESRLGKEIDYFRRNWYSEGLPYNWADLPGTGFIMSSQMDLLDTGDKEAWISQTREDLKGFAIEYLAQGLTFPIFYNIENVNGQERVVAPYYGNKLMVDTVSSQERNGVVKKTLEDKIEPFLLDAEDGAIAVMTSTAGPSGFPGSDGKEVIYPDSQTYILQKRGKEIVGFTIRTDFSRREHREFIKSLGGKELSEESSLEDYVDSVIFVDPAANADISDIVYTMQKSRNNTTGNIFAYKNRLWDEVYMDLLRRAELWRFDENSQEIFNEFRDHIATRQLEYHETKEALAVTVLRMAREIRPGLEYAIKENITFGNILAEVRSLPGCAGGGGSGLFDSITPRFGIEGLSDGEKFVCPRCEKPADGPVGNTCPNCGLTKEEWAEKSGKVCD